MLEEYNSILADFPMLKLMLALAVAFITLYGMVRAERQRRALPPQDRVPEATHLYIDGPIKLVVDSLELMNGTLGRMEVMLKAWDERMRIEREVATQTLPSADRREEERWKDMFELARDVLEALRRPRR